MYAYDESSYSVSLGDRPLPMSCAHPFARFDCPRFARIRSTDGKVRDLLRVAVAMSVAALALRRLERQPGVIASVQPVIVDGRRRPDFAIAVADVDQDGSDKEVEDEPAKDGGADPCSSAVRIAHV